MTPGSQLVDLGTAVRTGKAVPENLLLRRPAPITDLLSPERWLAESWSHGSPDINDQS
jgi:hypothetical protein